MISLKINKNCNINILSPSNPTPDDALSFTEIVYSENNTNFLAIEDQPIGFMEEIKGFFTKLVRYELPLNPTIKPYSVGYQYNIVLHHYWNALDSDRHLYNCDIFFKNTLTSKMGFAIFLYNLEEKIIMEITPDYAWDCFDLEDLPEGTIVPAFEQFIQSYKPIAIHEISQETAQEWITQADTYITTVEAQYPKWCKEHRDELYVLKEDV